jgi:hypothetical protein
MLREVLVGTKPLFRVDTLRKVEKAAADANRVRTVRTLIVKVGWVRLGWVGLGWVGMDWIVRTRYGSKSKKAENMSKARLGLRLLSCFDAG